MTEVIYIPRVFGGTIPLTVTIPTATIPTLQLTAVFRSGQVESVHRSGQQEATYRDGTVTAGGR